MDFNYDVFISYRHRPLDGAVVQKAFHMIEGYRLPAALQEKGHNIRRVFRDTEELAVSRILTDTIDKALHSCNCLMIVCSTDTPSSEWVDREVAMFIELGRADQVFPLLISGTPETSFPPSLKRIPDIMDRVMDVRADGNLKQILRKADTELLKLIAEATGVNRRELVKEHTRRRHSRVLGRSAAAAAAFFAIGAVSLGLMNAAQNYRDRAQAAEAASMQVLQELTYGLPDRLTSVPGAYGRISGILQENAEQINRILLLSTDQTSAGLEVAANYEKLATAMGVLGEHASAAAKEQEAVTLYEALCAETGDPTPLASAYNNLGLRLNASGQNEAAAEAYARALDLQRTLSDPQTLALMLANAGGNAVDLNRTEEAEAFFSEALSRLDPSDNSYNGIHTRATVAYNYGMLFYRQGNYPRAEELLRQAGAANEQLCALTDSIENRNAYLNTVSTLGLILTKQASYEEAELYLRKAVSLAEELAVDTENTVSLNTLATLHNHLGFNYNYRSNYSAAADEFDLARALFRELSEKSDSLDAVLNYAVACMNISDNRAKLRDFRLAQQSFKEGLRVYASVMDRLSSKQLAEYYSWQAYELLLCEQNTAAALDWALAAYDLQPENAQVDTICGYACLFAGYNAEADYLLGLVANSGAGQRDMILQDLDTLQAAGLESGHMEDLLILLAK